MELQNVAEHSTAERNPTEATSKRPYVAPALVNYGAVGALTSGAGRGITCGTPNRSDCVGAFSFSP